MRPISRKNLASYAGTVAMASLLFLARLGCGSFNATWFLAFALVVALRVSGYLEGVEDARS